MTDQAQKYVVAYSDDDKIITHAHYDISGERNPRDRQLDRARRCARRLSTKHAYNIIYVEAKDAKGVTIGAEGYANGRRDTQEGAGFKSSVG